MFVKIKHFNGLATNYNENGLQNKTPIQV